MSLLGKVFCTEGEINGLAFFQVSSILRRSLQRKKKTLIFNFKETFITELLYEIKSKTQVYAVLHQSGFSVSEGMRGREMGKGVGLVPKYTSSYQFLASEINFLTKKKKDEQLIDRNQVSKVLILITMCTKKGQILLCFFGNLQTALSQQVLNDHK